MGCICIFAFDGAGTNLTVLVQLKPRPAEVSPFRIILSVPDPGTFPLGVIVSLALEMYGGAMNVSFVQV